MGERYDGLTRISPGALDMTLSLMTRLYTLTMASFPWPPGSSRPSWTGPTRGEARPSRWTMSRTGRCWATCSAASTCCARCTRSATTAACSAPPARRPGRPRRRRQRSREIGPARFTGRRVRGLRSRARRAPPGPACGSPWIADSDSLRPGGSFQLTGTYPSRLPGCLPRARRMRMGAGEGSLLSPPGLHAAVACSGALRRALGPRLAGPPMWARLLPAACPGCAALVRRRRYPHRIVVIFQSRRAAVALRQLTTMQRRIPKHSKSRTHS